MYVLVVESPAKCKTIEGYLGGDFKVLSSYGHVRSLPTKQGSVDPDNDFKMIYELTDQGKKSLPHIIRAVKNAKRLYLATDPDREGESISWHLLQALKEKKSLPRDLETYRVTFNQITKRVVLDAINNPKEIDINLVSAQRLRQALDYLVGFTLSPLLWRKLPGSRSAGRVQSVALKILCERENEIDIFKSEEYWKIAVNLQNHYAESLETHLISIDGKRLEKTDIKNAEQVAKLLEKIGINYFLVDNITQKTINKNPPRPFITSTLQQFSSTNFGFNAKKTMSIAQKLYEGVNIDGELSGLITYMRTDGIYISEEAISEIRTLINDKFGEKYLPKKAITYKKKIKNAQEAHESIRPTNINLTPEKAKGYLNDEQFKLYDAIWRRSIASQMNPAAISHDGIVFISNDKRFITSASCSKLIFDGFYKVYTGDQIKDGDTLISKFFESIKEGDKFDISNINPKQNFTQPPPRYSEAGLIKKMEELGIGRPSTYATIISVLQDRAYATIQNRAFIPENRGRIVASFLSIFFERYVEYNFTANLEESLDSVADGKISFEEVLKDFWKHFNQRIEDTLKISIQKILEELNESLAHYKLVKCDFNIHDKCPKCSNGKITLNISRFGVFLGCSSHPDCKFNVNNDGNIKEGFPRKITESIDLCDGPYGLYLKSNGKNFAIPKNIDVSSIGIDFLKKIIELPKILGKHPQDESDIKLGIGPYGLYLLYNKRYYTLSLDKLDSITLNDAIDIITNAPEKMGKSTKSRKASVKNSTI